ncbi:hypothetical protein [Methylobacterium sp. ID0610]|uniref:hypothetical protein n=1 Tax=Methylobacterium carpenticola TaxID=3344827 RepID=UPI0036CF2B91
MEFRVEQEQPGQWGWRLLGPRGVTLLRSDETYGSQIQASAAATAFARLVVQASRKMTAPAPFA